MRSLEVVPINARCEMHEVAKASTAGKGESCIRDYNNYGTEWSPTIGEELRRELELSNTKVSYTPWQQYDFLLNALLDSY